MLRYGLWLALAMATLGLLFLSVISSETVTQAVTGSILPPLVVAAVFLLLDLVWAPVAIYKRQEEKIQTSREFDRTTQKFHEHRHDLAMLVKQGEEVKRRLYDSNIQIDEWKDVFNEWDQSVRHFITDGEIGDSYLPWYEDEEVQPSWVSGPQGLQGDEPQTVRDAWQLVQTRIQGLHYIAMALDGIDG